VTPDAELQPRTIAIGAFDGVHGGHRELIGSAEPPVTVVTWAPQPGDELLCPLGRRLELLAEAGAATVLVGRRGAPGPESGGAPLLVPDPDETDPSVQVAIRDALSSGRVEEAARLLGRPAEIEGAVVSGDARGRALGFPTANLAVESGIVVPALGIYAGWGAGVRAAISIGTNPTYGGDELRVEAFLLDFEGDLYGRRLVLELWERLRDEVAFPSESELVAAIAADVERTRAAVRPNVSSA
jgi:riboflavin kinase / FMN adenylyltransferase